MRGGDEKKAVENSCNIEINIALILRIHHFEDFNSQDRSQSLLYSFNFQRIKKDPNTNEKIAGTYTFTMLLDLNIDFYRN